MNKYPVQMIKRCIKLSLYYSSRIPLVYQVCQRMVNMHNGEQETDFAINGEQRFMQQMLKRAQVAFDVGANVGDWTSLALKANPALEIHCFEPSSATFEQLQARHFGKRVTLNHFGLGDMPGTASLHVTGENRNSGCNSLYVRSSLTEYQEIAVETISLETFDHYCQQAGLTAVDFVKIDTEGHELPVLKGMRRSMQLGCVKSIQFEYGGTYIDAHVLLRDVWEYVMEVNPKYKFYKLSSGGVKHLPNYIPALENFQYANYALILSE